ncbi:molybdopterin molybdenumtransferase MoeA [Candidatus Bathyarchaeota archaeon]|nr:MAG: molybdopterin molybdenumtransferase MoeA [Candidatus Bathyarchaeota archaeon]
MFRELISIEKAKRIILENTPLKPRVEEISIHEAYNRVLAEDIIAPFDVPPFDRSVVDGYAVRAEDTFGAEEEKPVKLKLAGQVNIGETPDFTLNRMEAAEIATGAAVPKGANAVVMIEYSSREDDYVLIYRPAVKGENIMKTGDDIKKGEAILKKGELLGPRKIGVLAALGLSRVRVYQKPKIAVISTGPEIVEPGKPIAPGKVYDINSYTLSAAVREIGATPIFIGIIPDNEEEIEKALKNALRTADAVITSGGVSVGKKDLIPRVLAKLGEPGILFCGLAIKPGKPTTFAVIEKKPIFSLPGQPTSALFTFYLLVKPALLRMIGVQEEIKTPSVEAYAGEKLFPARGRRTFIMVSLSRECSGRLVAYPIPKGLSGAITTLAKAEGYIEIPENRQFIDCGEKVKVYLFGN